MLKKLYDVQAKDLEIGSIDSEKSNIPQELIDLRDEHAKLQERLASKEQSYNDLRKQVKSNELEISNLTARRKASADASLTASSAKEASQYQNQELQFSTRLQELEEDTFPLLEKFETLENEFNALKDNMSELEPQLAEMNQAEIDRIEAIDESTKQLRLEREALTEKVSAQLLKQYEQVRRAKRGVGMALIINGKRCGGCNMQLPIHVLQKIKKDSAIVRCPSCGRILWNKPAD